MFNKWRNDIATGMCGTSECRLSSTAGVNSSIYKPSSSQKISNLVEPGLPLSFRRSRHTAVCRAAQEAGAPHREYIDRKNENVIFTPFYLGDHLSDWNQICCTVTRQSTESTFQILRKSLPPFPRYELPKFRFFSSFFFFFVFSHTCKNCCNKQTRTPIALKFGTQKGSPKANASIKFGTNPMNGSGVMTDYSRKTRSICCHAYRVNRFME